MGRLAFFLALARTLPAVAAAADGPNAVSWARARAAWVCRSDSGVQKQGCPDCHIRRERQSGCGVGLELRAAKIRELEARIMELEPQEATVAPGHSLAAAVIAAAAATVALIAALVQPPFVLALMDLPLDFSKLVAGALCTHAQSCLCALMFWMDSSGYGDQAAASQRSRRPVPQEYEGKVAGLDGQLKLAELETQLSHQHKKARAVREELGKSDARVEELEIRLKQKEEMTAVARQEQDICEARIEELEAQLTLQEPEAALARQELETREARIEELETRANKEEAVLARREQEGREATIEDFETELKELDAQDANHGGA